MRAYLQENPCDLPLKWRLDSALAPQCDGERWLRQLYASVWNAETLADAQQVVFAKAVCLDEGLQ